MAKESHFSVQARRRLSVALTSSLIFLWEPLMPRDINMGSLPILTPLYAMRPITMVILFFFSRRHCKDGPTDAYRGARTTINGQRPAARKSGFPFTTRLYSITFSLITQFLPLLSGAFPSFLPHCLLHSLPFRPELPAYAALALRRRRVYDDDA